VDMRSGVDMVEVIMNDVNGSNDESLILLCSLKQISL
jgi:hypothetical protein